MLLEIHDLTLRFGGVTALEKVRLSVDERETVAVIGPNGSGKTSLFNCISGLYRPTSGSVRLGGVELLGLPPDRVAVQGVARTFQGLRLCPGMTVLDNVMLGRHLHLHRSLLAATLGLRGDERGQRERVDEILDLLALRSFRDLPALSCDHAVQKRVELARALATGPRLLLLDEPMAGLSAREKEELAHAIGAIRERLGVTVLLVEHDLKVASRLAHRMVVLDQGRLLADGEPDEVRRRADVARAYLGDA